MYKRVFDKNEPTSKSNITKEIPKKYLIDYLYGNNAKKYLKYYLDNKVQKNEELLTENVKNYFQIIATQEDEKSYKTFCGSQHNKDTIKRFNDILNIIIKNYETYVGEYLIGCNKYITTFIRSFRGSSMANVQYFDYETLIYILKIYIKVNGLNNKDNLDKKILGINTYSIFRIIDFVTVNYKNKDKNFKFTEYFSSEEIIQIFKMHFKDFYVKIKDNEGEIKNEYLIFLEDLYDAFENVGLPPKNEIIIHIINSTNRISLLLKIMKLDLFKPSESICREIRKKGMGDSVDELSEILNKKGFCVRKNAISSSMYSKKLINKTMRSYVKPKRTTIRSRELNTI